jgi:hypothetical protein
MPFTPASLTSCKSWWDASDTATATVVGTDLHQLDDKIGHFAPMIGGDAPFTTYMDYGLRTVNGLNTASCSHNSVIPAKSMRAPNWNSGWPGAEGTIYVVCAVDQCWDDITPSIFTVYDQFPSQTRTIRLYSDDHYHLYFYPTAYINTTELSRHGIETHSSFMDCIAHVYKLSWSVSGNIVSFSGDGGELFPTLTGSGVVDFGTVTTGGPNIASNIYGLNQGIIQFCEMTLHNAYIADGSDDDLAMVEYFRNKWALQVGTNKLTTTTTSVGGLSGGSSLGAISIANDGTLFTAPKDNANCYRWDSGVNSRFINVFQQTRVPTASQAWGQGAPKCFDLAVAPSNSNRVYAVVNHLGSTTVWKSTDSGTTWTDTAHTVPFSASPGAGPCVAIDPSNPDKVMIGCSNGHIHESSNAGSSWSDRDLSASGGGTSYACIVFESTTSIYIGWLAGATNVLRSTNSGSSWSSAAASGPTTVRGICCSTTGVVYACSNAGTTTNAWKLSGGTWTNLSLAITGETWVFPAVDPNSATHMALISTSGYLQYSTDSGSTGYVEPVPPTTHFSSSEDVAWHISPFDPWGGNRPPNFGCNNSYAASRILFDPFHSGRLYLTCGTGVFYMVPVTTGPVVNVYGLVGGAGYTDGTVFTRLFTNITGTGSGARANFTVTGGVVTNVAFFVNGGTGYAQGNQLSCASADIGPGAGFSIKANIVDWTVQSKGIGGLQVNDICRVPIQNDLMNNMLYACQVKVGATPNAPRTEPTFIVGGQASDNGLCCDYAKATTSNQFMVSTSALWRSVVYGADGFCASDGVSNLGAVPGIDSTPIMTVSTTQKLCVLSGTGKKFGTGISESSITWSNCIGLPGTTASTGRSHTMVCDGAIANAETVYALIPNNGVYRSINGGLNWSQITVSSAALPANYAQGSQLSSVPGQAGHLFFAGGNTGGLPLARSTNATSVAATWSAVSNVTEAWQVSVGATAPTGSYPSIFITGKISGDSDPGVFRSDNNCTSWTRVCRAPAGNLDAPNKLVADLDNYGTFMVSMGTTGFSFGELDTASTQAGVESIPGRVLFEDALWRAAPRRIPQVPQWAATPTIAVSDTDFFMFAGQSNMIGSGTTGSADLAPYPWIVTDSNIKSYDGAVFNTYTIGPATQWGPEAQFSYLWRQRFPLKKFYFLKIAVSSTFLANTGGGDTWSPSAVGAWFDFFKAYADLYVPAVAADRGTSGRITLCWMQGESDGTNTTHASNYQTNLTNFFSNVRSRWAAANTKIIVGRVANTEPFASAVRSGQAAAVAATASTALVNTDSYPLADALHYNPAGQISLGADMFNAYLGLT